MTAMDGREVHLDLRLVPAALTTWAVTAAGILWSIGGIVSALVVTIAAATTAAWWGSTRRGARARVRLTAAGAVAVALAGLGFAVAVQLRVEHASRHPIIDRYGTVADVIVTPTETPRSVGGGRMMSRMSKSST